MSAVLVLYLHNIKHVRWFMDNGANNWWKSSGFYVVYHCFQPLTIIKILEKIGSFPEVMCV